MPGNKSSFASLQVDSPPPSPVAPAALPPPASAPAHSQKASQKAAKPAKPKKPAVKRPTPAETASSISTEQFKQLLEDIAGKYKADQVSQLETVADFFVSAFKDSDLAFGRNLHQLSLQQVWQGLLPGKLRHNSGIHLGSCCLQAHSLLSLVRLSAIQPATHASIGCHLSLQSSFEV